VFRTAVMRTAPIWRQPRSTETYGEAMSREVNIGSRKFWIVSEPHDKGWKAQVLEVVDAKGGTQDVGIQTTGETRSMADDRAIGQLQHRLRDQSF
jgi:hypothetical protein